MFLDRNHIKRSKRGNSNDNFLKLNFLGDISGAFADFGVFLPLVIGLTTVAGFHAGNILIGFGLFAISVAIIYHRPIPVQPMKIFTSLAIAGSLSYDETIASGFLIGIILLVTGLTGVIRSIAELMSQSILTGIQVGVGAQLIFLGVGMLNSEYLVGCLILFAIMVLLNSRFKLFAYPLLILFSILFISPNMSKIPNLSIELYIPQFHFPEVSSFVTAFTTGLIPQLALTLTNAVLLTALLAKEYFSSDSDRITEKRLALSSGVLNIMFAPIGAIPMCHGSGGLTVQHKFGARTGLAPAIFGTTCLGLGLFFSDDIIKLFLLIPSITLGILLIISGFELANTKRLFNARLSCSIVIILTALSCVLFNILTGLIIGIISEILRKIVIRKFLKDF